MRALQELQHVQLAAIAVVAQTEVRNGFKGFSAVTEKKSKGIIVQLYHPAHRERGFATSRKFEVLGLAASAAPPDEHLR